MKKDLKGFIVGVLVTVVLMSTVAFAAGTKQNIEVVFNSVNLAVNGRKVAADNILYKGTTYVPLRSVAEMLGKKVAWDQKTNTASINDKGGVIDVQPGVSTVTVEELPYTITILEPDSIGNRYMEATYTNNSKYPITGMSLTVLLKDKNKKTYLTNYDTVLPGETSPKFSSFAPDTGSYDDVEILNIEIRAEGANGETIRVEYDAKLKKYIK